MPAVLRAEVVRGKAQVEAVGCSLGGDGRARSEIGEALLTVGDSFDWLFGVMLTIGVEETAVDGG